VDASIKALLAQYHNLMPSGSLQASSVKHLLEQRDNLIFQGIKDLCIPFTTEQVAGTRTGSAMCVSGAHAHSRVSDSADTSFTADKQSILIRNHLVVRPGMIHVSILSRASYLGIVMGNKM
jgi:hypothetical protein